MNCSQCRRHWELYYDSEGDSELYLQINEHLSTCPRCSKWFFQQEQFEELVTDKLSASAPTPDLWQRVLLETGIASSAVRRSRMFFGSCIALAASLMIVIAIWRTMPGGDDEHLSALTAGVHRAFAEHGRRVEFVSVSAREVERYLKQRVPFVVRCPPRENAGFEIRGGGICAIAGDPAAYVLGRVGGREVSIFILPEERLARFDHEREVLGREALHHCREGELQMVLAKIDRNVVIAIGKAAPRQLERVVRAYGTYADAPPTGAA